MGCGVQQRILQNDRLSKYWRLEHSQASVKTTHPLVHTGLINPPPTMYPPTVYLKSLHMTKSLRPPSSVLRGGFSLSMIHFLHHYMLLLQTCQGWKAKLLVTWMRLLMLRGERGDRQFTWINDMAYVYLLFLCIFRHFSLIGPVLAKLKWPVCVPVRTRHY